jgi:hypothetical protein
MSMTANPPAVLGDPHHLPYHSSWIADLVQRKAADNQIELCVDPRQIGGISLQKGEVVEMVSVCQPLGLLQHLWHEIQTMNVGHTRCESAAQMCRTTGDIEHNPPCR